MDTVKKNYFKYIAGFIACLLLRLIPFRPPNIEPILATQMPFSKAYGKYAGFLFAFLSIVLYDIITGKVGMWTFITATMYGILGLWAAFYLNKKENNITNYVKFSIIGTIVYDVITGLSIGPIFYGQSFMSALIGQIPFTLMHLVGNVSFAIVLSPLIYKFVIQNTNLETKTILQFFKIKQI